MDLRVVEIFCDVAQRRSFSRGAAVHDVSQSWASQAVHALEERLGTQLIDRSKRPLVLTPAGQLYFDGCREVLGKYREVEDQVRQLQDRIEGVVRVAAIYSVGLMQMDRYLRRFEELYPRAQVRLEYLHPDQVYQQVQLDAADMGFVSFPRHSNDIECIDWQVQPIVLVAAPGHRLAGRSEIPLTELAGESFIAFTPELQIRREIDRWLKRAHVEVSIVHEFDNTETIKRVVEYGSGVALLPGPTVRREVEAGTLISIPLNDPRLVRPLGIVHKRTRRLSIAAQKWIELIQQDADTFPVPEVTQVKARS